MFIMSYIGELKDRIDTLKDIKDKEIESVLSEIVKRYEDLEKQVIDYETSTQLGLGYELLKYGKILKVLYNCFDNSKKLEELLKDINSLYELELFDSSEYILEEFEDKIMEYLERDNYNFDTTLMDLISYVEQKLIIDSILKQVN